MARHQSSGEHYASASEKNQGGISGRDPRSAGGAVFQTTDGQQFADPGKALDHASELLDADLSDGIFKELRAAEQMIAANAEALKSADVAHFVQCASNGQYRGASGGEMACNRIALAILERLDDLGAIDNEAVRGALALMRAAAGPWPSDDVYRRVIQMLKRAAGK